MKFACAGAGISCAVIANRLACAGHHLSVFEGRNHLAGNCYMERDDDTGVLVHVYGPHIFHTNDKEVWSFVNKFAEFRPYINRVKTRVKDRVYSLPVNLHTINQFFDTALDPGAAKALIESKADRSMARSQNFEEQALFLVGKELYLSFFKGYTLKQWGLHPRDLPAGILKRLPVRFNYDDNYFSQKYQGIPVNGYTEMVEQLLDHPNIQLFLDHEFTAGQCSGFEHVFYSGSLDSFFDYGLGRLPYRTLDFIHERHPGDYQGVAIMNYGDETIPFTRITEHKHLAPWESHENTIISREFSRECGIKDTPYYPVRLARDQPLLQQYRNMALNTDKLSFVGRLGTYCYLDMDACIRRAMDAATVTLDCMGKMRPIPPFFEQY